MHLYMFCLCPCLWEEMVHEKNIFFKCKGKACCWIFELHSQKAAVMMKMRATSILVLGTVGFRKTHRAVVTLGAENKPCTTWNPWAGYVYLIFGREGASTSLAACPCQGVRKLMKLPIKSCAYCPRVSGSHDDSSLLRDVPVPRQACWGEQLEGKGRRRHKINV